MYAIRRLLLLAFQKDTPPLDNQPAGTLLAGTVVDAFTGQPIAGAEVIVSFGAIRPIFLGSEIIVDLPNGVLGPEALREGAEQSAQRRTARAPGSGLPMYSVRTDSSGRFAFRNLAVGVPVLRDGSAAVVVSDSDVDDVELRVNGTLVTDGLLDIPTGIDNHIEFMLSPDGRG